ncbi:hypothetical protein NC653_028824 [Populus alba x Populus x berolinensis]|uniref:Uncharacterized protein n=1 Tax=Populus alba x Populus x berolinensis TaxID=444605 RepID=A0AAD6M3F6_9ROSI|nr:hypothetical protein NC653_028824 [Populus alba x Populus x berolinensis]
MAASYLWRKYADYLYTKWERTILWDMIEPYRRPKSFTPLVTIYVAAFYTGVIGSALTEQLYKEKYWEDHPGEAVPLMKPKFYSGPSLLNLLRLPVHYVFSTLKTTPNRVIILKPNQERVARKQVVVKEKQDSAEAARLSAAASQEPPRNEQNITPGAPVVGSSSVRDKIESCLHLFMNKEDVVKTLFELDGIEPGVTSLAWNQLEEEKPEIFKDFYAKLILEESSSTSNQLLEQQKDLENFLACLDDPLHFIEEDFQHIPGTSWSPSAGQMKLLDILPWGDTIPLEVPIPSGDPYIDSLSTVSCRQLVDDENPASDSFHPAQMNFERLMAMDRNAADIARVPLFINLEILNPASVADNDQTEAEHDPILSCLNSPEQPGPVFVYLTDTSTSSIFLDPPEPNFNPGSAILPDLPDSNFNPGNSILPDTPETNFHPDFGTLLDPPKPKIDVDGYFNVSSLDSQSEEES